MSQPSTLREHLEAIRDAEWPTIEDGMLRLAVYCQMVRYSAECALKVMGAPESSERSLEMLLNMTGGKLDVHVVEGCTCVTIDDEPVMIDAACPIHGDTEQA
jgi:hypothetical protein